MALTKIDDRGLNTPIDLLDDEKIRFGTTDNDLEIFHGSNISTIKDGKGDLRIMSDTIRIQRNAGGENYIYATEGGAVKLHYDGGNAKLETTASGVKITGKIQIYNQDDANINVLEVFNENTNNSGFFSQNSDGDGTLGIKTDEGNLNVFFKSDGDSYLNGGNLGIGTASPSSLLELNAANDTAKLTFLRAGTSIGGSINTRDESGSAGKGLTYIAKDGNSAKAQHVFCTDDGTNVEERLKIDESGRILIGGASVTHGSTNADDLQIGANNQANQTGITLGSASASSIRWADAASDSAAMINYDHASGEMTIQANGEDSSTYGHINFKVAASDNSGSSNVITMSRGSSGASLHFPNGGGIDFSSHVSDATGMSSEILDDYESGSWTPVFKYYDNSVWNTCSFTNNLDYTTGRYIKVGNIVHGWYYTGFCAMNSAANNKGAQIHGLPFNFKNGEPYYGGTVVFTHCDMFSDGTNPVAVHNGYMNYQQNLINPTRNSGVNGASWNTSGNYMMVSFTYESN